MGSNSKITLSVHLHYETDAAILVSDDGVRSHAVWLPLSQIEAPDDRELETVIEVEVPEWLATQKGLV